MMELSNTLVKSKNVWLHHHNMEESRSDDDDDDNENHLQLNLSYREDVHNKF